MDYNLSTRILSSCSTRAEVRNVALLKTNRTHKALRLNIDYTIDDRACTLYANCMSSSCDTKITQIIQHMILQNRFPPDAKQNARHKALYRRHNFLCYCRITNHPIQYCSMRILL